MRARFLFLGAILLAGALAACGGGGGGNGTPPTTHPTATATATATATSTATAGPPNSNGCVTTAAVRRSARTAAVGVQPITAAGSFSYTGNLTETIDRSSPCPIGTSTAAATVGITATMTTATNEHDVETDNYATNSTTVTTDASVAESTPGTSDTFSESKEVSTDEVGDVTTTTYTSPLLYAVASPLPYPTAITNLSPSSILTALADSSSTSRTYGSAGAYSEIDTLAGVTATNQLSVTPTGAATYLIQTPNFAGAPNNVSSVTLKFSAPSGGLITVSQTLTGGATPPPSGTITAWYSAGTPLYSDTTVDAGSGSVSPSCSPDPGVTSAYDFRRTIVNIDPALGSYDTRTIDSYVAPNYQGNGITVGPVCVVINDTEKLFYDYFFDTPAFFYLSGDGKPFQTDTIVEAYWFASSPTAPYTRVRDDASSPGGVPGLAASIAAHTAGITFTRETQRAQRIEAFLRAMHSVRPGGIIK